MSRLTPVNAMNSWPVPGDVRGYYTRLATGFAGILAAPAQVKHQPLPAWESPARPPQCFIPGLQGQGFCPSKLVRPVSQKGGLGEEGGLAGAPSRPMASPFVSHSCPSLLSIVNPSPPPPSRPELGRVSPFLTFLLFLCRGSQDPRVAQGPRLPWQAGAVYGFWKLCGRGGVELATGAPGRGRRWARELTYQVCPERKGCSGGCAEKPSEGSRARIPGGNRRKRSSGV